MKFYPGFACGGAVCGYDLVEGNEMTANAGTIRVQPSAVLRPRRGEEDLDLISRVRMNDRLAFRDLVLRYQARVCSMVYRILRDRERMEQAVQRVFANVYFAIRRFECRNSLRLWIYRNAIHECYAAGGAPGFLNELLAGLDEEERLLLILKEVEGHSIEELEEITGMEARDLRKRLVRARRRLVGQVPVRPRAM